MPDRKAAFALIMFTPSRAVTSPEEFLLEGEGVTVRVPLQQFLESVDWPVLLTKHAAWAKEQDAIRKKLFDAGQAEMQRDLQGYMPKVD